MGMKAAAATFWGAIIARAWEDDDFKKRLIADPEGELANLGYDIVYDPNGNKLKIKVEEAPADKAYEACVCDGKILTIYLPKPPDNFDQFEFKGQFTAGGCC